MTALNQVESRARRPTLAAAEHRRAQANAKAQIDGRERKANATKYVSGLVAGAIPGVMLPANLLKDFFLPHARAVLIASGPAVDAMVLNLMSGSTRSSLIAPFKTPKCSDLR